MEPRARASRHKSQLNFPDELRQLLYGAGTPAHPDHIHPLPDASSQRYLRSLPSDNKSNPITPFTHTKGENTIPEPYAETLRVLDEIVTDYVIETSHAALQLATYAGRAKLKVQDFEWVMKRDRKKLGRVQEMLRRKKEVAEARKAAGPGGGEGAGDMTDLRKMGVADLQNLGDIVGEEGTGKGKGKGRGRRKKRAAEDEEGDAGAQQALLQGAGGSAAGDDLGDVDADVNDLEADDDVDDRHRSKRARSDAD